MLQSKRKFNCEKITQAKLLLLFVSFILSALFPLFVTDEYASAVATQSTLTLSISDSTLTASIMPAVGGTFGTPQTPATISVFTDNFTGYTLTLSTSGGTSLVNSNNDEVQSISSNISEQTFSTDPTYNNKWGFKPSQYVTTSNNVDTVVNNSDYLPAPSSQGLILDKTTAKNATNTPNTYTLTFGARVDTTLPAGTYTGTYVVTAVANSIVYNITYDDNHRQDETISSMPSQNPQALQIDGGTPVAQSYGTLSSAVPTMSAQTVRTFGGWCTTSTTYNSTTGNDECSGTTYQPGDSYPIDQTADGTNITLYAIWLTDPFPMVWSQMGKCVFTATQTGSNPATYDGDVSGSECTEYAGDDYIDTGIALYSNDNYQKDYEVHFTLDSFNPGAQLESQATIFNDKLSSEVTGSPYGGKSPGLVVRITSSKTFEIKSTYGAPTDHAEEKVVTKTPYATAYNGTDVRIFRINGIIYTSIDNGPLVELQDYTPFNQQFGLTAWFGAYPDNINCTENCTAAKRFLTGEMSNMYIKLGDMPANGIHDITFDANGGTPSTTTYKIVDGDALSELPAVTRSGFIFDGWWTASSGGQQVSASTVPDSTTTYYAHWYKSVTDAQITNTSVSLAINGTETIAITNASDIEPYTLVSSDSTVATVDASGVITGVANGTATITMTGTKTGDTRTINVTVGSVIAVDFDSDGGLPATFQENVADGGSFSSLPEPTKSGYTLEGWYTGTNGTGTQLTTSTVFTSSTPTQYYAYWTQTVYVCKIATSRHSEQCAQSGSNGCKGASWGTNTIEYGYLISDSSPVSAGAAYDCDVNYDGTYDEETERFYYFGTENGNAKLIYYKNMANNASVAYNDAIALLPNYELDVNNPTVPVWDNPNLVTYTSGDYAGKAARFMTYPEISNGLYTGGNNHITPSDSESTYLFEQSNFATANATDGIWLEKQPNFDNRIQTRSRQLTHGSTSANAARPTIEVPTGYMEPYTAPAATYDITFDPHNETASWTETIDAGDDLSDVYPTDPTYTNHVFKGWWTAQSGGSQINSSTQPSGNTTYHAQWKSTVDLAVFDNDHLTVEEGSTVTISITGPSDLEDYSFASDNSSIATVDSNTGVITGVTAGSTTITMTGSDSTHTRTIYIEVTAPAVTYTVYFNPHNGSANSSVTVTAGSTIGSNNIPADPMPSSADDVFMGWFTAVSGGTVVDGNTMPSVDGETYHAQYKKIVCKLAAAGTLHSSNTKVSPNSGKVEYGQIANDPTPQSGDAYDCDVDYDDTYSAVNERFYYLGQDANNNAVLVAWNSYYDDAWAPGTSSDSLYSYTDALTELPDNTSGAWDNPGLIEQETGKAARFTTRAEVATACGTTVSGLGTTDILVNCDYLMEHAKYDGGGRSALWLVKENNNQYRIHTDSGNRKVSTSTGTSMVRPTIVVPDKLIEKYSPTYLDVTNAVISNDLILAVGDQITIVVGNASQLEPYTFSSADPSKATVDINTGVITGVGAGTTNIIMTGSQSGLYKYLEVTVAPAPTTNWTVTFNANGGSLDNGASRTRTVDDGDVVGALPTASKANYRFFGWYTDDGTFYTEVYPEETVTADITYYAKWVEDTSSFPIEWAEINECIFTGAAVTGTYCGNTSSSQYYIDTAVQLFTQANYGKDFEVGFTITEYSPSSQIANQGNQATFVSFKKEDSANNYPGFVVRRYSSSNTIEITSRWKGDSQSLSLHDFASTTKTVKLLKRKEVEQGNTYYRVYYSVDGSAWTLYEDITNKTHFEFDTKVWFGGAANSNGTSPMRPLVGKMTDMYVRLGVDSDFTVELDANGGTLPSGFQNPYTITAGSSVGTLPTPTAPSANYTFGGWYNGNTLVSDGTQYIPQSNVILVADWVYQSSDTPVIFDVSNNATRGFQALSSAWAQSPVNLTTFNEASPINNSTWGDTTELSELQYWEAVRSNFVNNQCFIQTSTAHNTNSDAVKPLSALSNWTSGSVDCSKPDVYDTKINAALTVRLNDPQGAVVAYAKADNGIIHNMIPGQTYYWEKTSDSSVYGYVTATSNGSSTGTRWVDTDVVRNVRDLGGLPVTYTDSNNQTVTGTLAYGRLFRGEKMQNVSASEFTNLGITTEYNVGDEYSSDTHLSDYHLNTVIHYNFDYNSGDENNANSNYMKAWTAVTNIMTDIANTNTTKNIFFHCRVGADRTGTVAYLLEGLLGVPDEMRYEEYALTNLSGLYDRTRYYKQKASNNANKFVFMMGYVQTTQDIYDWYMHNPNASTSLIQAFRTAMTVPSNGGSGQQNNMQSPLSLNNASPLLNLNQSSTNSTSTNTNSSSDEVAVANSSDGYNDPLGATEAFPETYVGSKNADSSSVVGLGIAAAAIVASGSLSYALAKKQENMG